MLTSTNLHYYSVILSMRVYTVFATLFLLSQFQGLVAVKIGDVKKYEEKSLTNDVVELLNGTYFNLNEKVCQLERRVDAIEGGTDSHHRCGYNATEILEFKRAISNEIQDFSKLLSGFENDIRILSKEQSELRDLLGVGNGGVPATMSTTTSTTPESRDCKEGWIESPEKCYYVSSRSERTEWADCVNRCRVMGGHLVEIKTNTEARFIMGNLPRHVGSSDYFYTGRERRGSGRNDWYYLSNGEKIDTSRRSWAHGEPDNTDSQQCGCTKTGDNFDMHDCVCTGHDLYFICEITR
ncbi:asialoglycoprotein receptor 1-like [Argopecten irradians]|uniref:asialoglycoprotein receptor 1-like n=1 Tax=Argopecten irradians TaxID=31199 RepID=UPI003722AF24